MRLPAVLILPTASVGICPTKPEDGQMTPDPQCEPSQTDSAAYDEQEVKGHDLPDTLSRVCRANLDRPCLTAVKLNRTAAHRRLAAGRLALEQVNGKTVTDIGKSAVNEEMENCKCDNAFRYEINGAPYVYYHRLKDPSGFDTYEVMTGCWKEEGNKVNDDIWLFSTEAEMLKGDWHPAWRYCDYDDCANHVGFPRDCGPRAAVLRNWNCLEGSNLGDCQKNTKFYVRTCGGVLPLAISTNLGWTFSWCAILGAMAYLVVGMGMENRRTGAKGVKALPHRAFWLQLHGLVMDGVQFSARRAGVTLPAGSAYSRLPAHAAPAPPTAPPSSRSDESKRQRGRKEEARPSRKAKTDKKKARAKDKDGRRPAASAPAAEAPAGSASSEAGAEATVEERARQQLAEQRDTTVHSSMAKVQVVTL